MPRTCGWSSIFSAVINLLPYVRFHNAVTYFFRCYRGQLALIHKFRFFVIHLSSFVSYFPLHRQIVSHQQFLPLLYACLKEASPLLGGSQWSLAARHFAEFVVICKWKYQVRLIRSKWKIWGLNFVPLTSVTFLFTCAFSSAFHYYSNGKCTILEQVPIIFTDNSIFI